MLRPWLFSVSSFIFAACSGGSSSDDGIKTPGEDCSDEAAAADPWCDGDKNACVTDTCRLPCEQASQCSALVNHVCCEVESEVTDMACLPEAVVPSGAQCAQ